MKIILGNDSLGKKENLLAPSSYKNSGQISIALLWITVNKLDHGAIEPRGKLTRLLNAKTMERVHDK